MDPPFPPNVDSTSKLLGGLNLIGNAPDKDMDEMDLFTVVPDSAGRLKMTSQSRSSAANAEIDGGFRVALPERKVHARKVQSCRTRGSGLTDHLSRGNSQDEAEHEHQFERASLACLMSKDLNDKISPPTGGPSFEHEQDGIFNENEMSFSPSACFHSSVRRDSRKNTDKEWYLLDNEGIRKGESCGSGADLSNSSVSFCEEERVDMLVGGNVRSKFANKGKGIESSANSRGISVLPQSSTFLSGMSWKNEGKKSLVHDGLTSPCLTSPDSITKTKNSPVLDDCSGIDSSLNRDPRSNNDIVGETVDYDSDLRNGQLCQTQIELDALSQRNRQRRLLHSGFISFSDVGGTNNNDKFGWNACNDGSSSQKLKIVIPDTEERSVGKKKGKAIIHDNRLQHTKDKTRSNRQCSVPNKEVTVGTNSGGHPLRLSADKGWRTALDSITQATTLSSEDNIDVPKRKHIMYIDDDNPEVTTSHSRYRPNSAQPTSNVVSGDRSHRRHKMMKNRRKNNFLRAQEGECSSSVLEDSEVLCVESSVLPSNQKPTRIRCSRRHSGTSLGPVIEIDELDFPEGANSNSGEQSQRAFNDSSATARQVESDEILGQVESDEILARQLQEQLFNELPDFDISEEVDATIAMALQHEENSSRLARRGQAHPRDFSMAHLYAQYPQLTSRNPAGRTTVRDRAPPSRMSHMRRRFNRPLTDRHNFLNALEAEFNSRSGWSTSPGVLPYQHEFNGNDYEMLLTLDDNIRHAGASQRHLDNLPESIVHQSDNIEEACAICLEIPTVGETIRHLPCLHKFHKDCIDKWLRRKTFCPVCKSGIT
ncbi:putative transcription factor C2H2 family [Dioscorea sansibarensis]